MWQPRPLGIQMLLFFWLLLSHPRPLLKDGSKSVENLLLQHSVLGEVDHVAGGCDIVGENVVLAPHLLLRRFPADRGSDGESGRLTFCLISTCPRCVQLRLNHQSARCKWTRSHATGILKKEGRPTRESRTVQTIQQRRSFSARVHCTRMDRAYRLADLPSATSTHRARFSWFLERQRTSSFHQPRHVNGFQFFVW